VAMPKIADWPVSPHRIARAIIKQLQLFAACLLTAPISNTATLSSKASAPLEKFVLSRVSRAGIKAGGLFGNPPPINEVLNFACTSPVCNSFNRNHCLLIVF
jgi:hypothetical protein